MKKKKVLTIILMILVVITARYSIDYKRKQIINCVEDGNTFNYCKYQVGK